MLACMCLIYFSPKNKKYFAVFDEEDLETG